MLVYGKVSDFDGVPLADAEIQIKNKKFENLYTCITNDNGVYEANVNEDTYYAIAIIKDYGTKFLEYWAWNVPVYEDTEINGKIDKLELYAINAFIPQGAYPSVITYFRPMSLSRYHKVLGSGNTESLEIIDIAPKLTKDSIKVHIQGEEVEILNIDKLYEYSGNKQKMCAYAVQSALPTNFNTEEFNRIDIEIFDTATNEKGAGCTYFRV